MIIEQLSIFLENKSGRLTEVTDTLGDSNINISALSLAETAEFGILRLIVTDPGKAAKALRQRHFSVNLTRVVGIIIPDEPGSLARVLKILSDEDISIEYMYAYAFADKASVVIRTENIEQTIETLQKHKIELLRASDVYEI
ncbi:ACT domain-containing protein [candidate division KSB1 bacterium]|nr:ACT domain-containing protein [candidate division KSB1 bacterium]